MSGTRGFSIAQVNYKKYQRKELRQLERRKAKKEIKQQLKETR